LRLKAPRPCWPARRKEVLDEIAAQINGKGQTAFVVAADVTKEADVARLFAETKRAFGRVDVVINNAGVPSATPVDEMTLPYWNEVLAVNLTGPVPGEPRSGESHEDANPAGRPHHQYRQHLAEDAAPGFHGLHGDQARAAGHDPSSSPWMAASTAWCRRSFTPAPP
jgi:Short-chain dehydrogenases of various substrate specificities